MLVGSSIDRQLAPFIKGNNIFFQGAMNLDLVKRKLLKVSYTIRILIATGNTIFPSGNCNGHKCLCPFDMDTCTNQSMALLDLLFKHCSEIRIIEPHPRCKKIKGHPDCTFWEDIQIQDRFKTLICRLKQLRSGNSEKLGIVSNAYLLSSKNSKFTWALTGPDLVHFSELAVKKLSHLLK